MAVAVVLIITPGQDTAVTIRNSVRGGRRSGVATALGVVTGQLAWAAAATTGLAAVLAASPAVFTALKMAGGMFLAYLGFRSLWRARHRSSPLLGAQNGPSRGDSTVSVPYRQGLVSNLGNPKIGVFFTSLLPQFVEPGPSWVLGMLIFGVVFALMTLCWLAGYATLIDGMATIFQRGRVPQVLEALTGLVLVSLGFGVLASAN